MTILTDANGRPFVKPAIEDYATLEEYARAFYAYKDAVTRVSNGAFDTAWRAAMRSVK